MRDDKVLVDEARKTAQHQRVKARIQHELDREIEARAAQPDSAALAELHRAAAALRGNAVTEIGRSERALRRGRWPARVSRMVNYGFGLVYALLAIRLALALLAAAPGAGFTRFITAVSDPFLAPFRGILPSLTSPKGYTLALPILLAVAMYAVLHLAIRGLLKLLGGRETSIRSDSVADS